MQFVRLKNRFRLQFSSIMYEHPNEAVRNALRIATDDNTSFYASITMIAGFRSLAIDHPLHP